MPLRSSLAAIVDALGPWADPLALPALRQVYLPLSRLWAAASIHSPDDPRFTAETALSTGNRLTRGLIDSLVAPVMQRRREHDAALSRWEDAFFRAVAPAADLAAIERERRMAAARWMATRLALAPLLLLAAVPPVRLRIPTPPMVTAAYGRFLDQPDATFLPPPASPAIETSRAMELDGQRIYWLRFRAPHQRLDDTVTARVTEPVAPVPTATVIAGNGVFIEPEMYPDRLLEIAGHLAPRGIRVVEPTSPWHGRRTPPGWYGGERFFAAVPLGTLDLLVGQALELAALTRWCRLAFGSPVGVVGVSMSALVAQLAISRCDQWPSEARADAAFLMLHSGDIEAIAFAGELVHAMGLMRALEAAGWSRPALRRWTALMAPGETLGVAPERVVSLLARDDRVMPVGGGILQLDAWRVPATNRFVWPHSHMSVPTALRLDDAPVRRFLAVLGQRT